MTKAGYFQPNEPDGPDELQRVYADLQSAQAEITIYAGRNIALTARIARMEADLLECLEYLEKYSDVIDGVDGIQMPNKAMSLCTMIKSTLFGEGNFR